MGICPRAPVLKLYPQISQKTDPSVGTGAPQSGQFAEVAFTRPLPTAAGAPCIFAPHSEQKSDSEDWCPLGQA
jgi:hypothetical protein